MAFVILGKANIVCKAKITEFLYGTSIELLGKINIPTNNFVITKATAAGIYATGHNPVIQIPRKGCLYMVYS